MVILPEAGTETTIPSDRTFENFSTIHTVNRLDPQLSFGAGLPTGHYTLGRE